MWTPRPAEEEPPRAFIALAVALVVAVGCGGVSTLGPTPAGEGIVVYLRADFAGPSQAINVDLADLGKVGGSCSSGAEGETPTWADCISSVKVMPGWSATLYRDPNYRGVPRDHHRGHPEPQGSARVVRQGRLQRLRLVDPRRAAIAV